MLSTCVVASSCQGRRCYYPTPNTQEKSVPPFFNATKNPLRHYKPPMAATMTFFTSVNTVEIYT